MGFFPKAKSKSELVLVFDIGSSSVGGALFYTDKSGIPKIIFSIREPIVAEEKVDVDRLFSLTLNTLLSVVEKISAKGLGAPTKVLCILSSPWYISQTRVITLQKDTPFLFTSKLADDLIPKEVELVKGEYAQKYIHVGKDLRPIELKNVKVMLNGYETPDPLQKKTKELEMNIFISLSSEDVCKKIEDTIAKRFSVNPIKFSSFTMASFTVARDLQKEKSDFILINISGEITDIGIVKNNILHESTSFPMGANTTLRIVATGTNSSLSEAKSFLSVFKDGHASVETMEKLYPLITKSKQEWIHKFQESLASLSNDISVPSLIYITVDKELEDFFMEVIRNEQFSQYTLTESKFEIVFLNAEILHDISELAKDVTFDSIVAIDSIYINRFLN